MAVKLIDPQPGQRILDYGCGDGHLMDLLNPAEVVGFDPNANGDPRIVRELPSSLFDVITCCEVLEHVSLGEANRILVNCQKLLKPKGKLIVSVPLEVGPSSLLKNVVRYAVVRPRETNLTIANVLKIACYTPIERLDYGDGYFGHMGFDYLEIERILRRHFTIKRRVFSPVPMFGWAMNSQVFYELSV